MSPLPQQHRQDRRARCDILLTPHPAPATSDRLDGKAPLIDRSACRDYAAQLTKPLDERLAKEEGEVSWRVTVPCTRAQGEAIAGAERPVHRLPTIRRCSSPTSRTEPSPTTG